MKPQYGRPPEGEFIPFITCIGPFMDLFDIDIPALW